MCAQAVVNKQAIRAVWLLRKLIPIKVQRVQQGFAYACHCNANKAQIRQPAYCFFIPDASSAFFSSPSSSSSSMGWNSK
jgi:hypothetical protein